MMSKYTKFTTDLGVEYILRDDGNDTISWISTDESNSDYQRYLRWLENPNAEEGGTL